MVYLHAHRPGEGQHCVYSKVCACLCTLVKACAVDVNLVSRENKKFKMGHQDSTVGLPKAIAFVSVSKTGSFLFVQGLFFVLCILLRF